jgi:hypothetical protein
MIGAYRPRTLRRMRLLVVACPIPSTGGRGVRRTVQGVVA